MKGKTHDFKGEVYTKLPEEVVKKLGIDSGDELEFSIEGDKVLITASGKGLSDDEMSVLRKVNSVKYYERSMHNVMNDLSGSEPNIMKDLFKKRILFEYEKEGSKLVGIDKKFFPYLTEKETSIVDKLFSQGFIIVEEPALMKKINNQLIESKKAGQVKGIKGFDGKFYIVTMSRFSELKPRVEKILGSEKPLEKIASELSISEDLAKAVLEIMKEDGDIIEKSKDVFIGV